MPRSMQCANYLPQKMYILKRSSNIIKKNLYYLKNRYILFQQNKHYWIVHIEVTINCVRDATWNYVAPDTLSLYQPPSTYDIFIYYPLNMNSWNIYVLPGGRVPSCRANSCSWCWYRCCAICRNWLAWPDLAKFPWRAASK